MRADVKRPKISIIDLDQRALRVAFLDWIIINKLPFKLVRSLFFRVLLDIINSIINQILFRSNVTIRNDLARAVCFRRPDIERTLTFVRSRIYLIMDAWTSPSSYVLLGVKCRFLDLFRISKAHNGAELTKLLFGIIESYGSIERIEFLISRITRAS